MDPQKNIHPASSDEGQQTPPSMANTPQVTTPLSESNVSTPAAPSADFGSSSMPNAAEEVAVSSADPGTPATSTEPADTFSGANQTTPVTFPAPEPANEAGTAGDSSMPSIAGEESGADSSVPAPAGPEVPVSTPPLGSLGDTPAGNVSNVTGPQSIGGDQTGLTPDVAPVGVPRSNDKKTIMILGVVAVVLIIAIVVLFSM